jgi:c-di-GMP-binding flagellar brake protein YcgR
VSDTNSSTDVDERFFVHGRMEILDLLNDLILRCEPITVSFDNGKDCLATTLLEARAKTLIFEESTDAALNERFLKSRNASFVARPDGIRVQFFGNPAKRISWGGNPAFSVPLPQRVVRLQRQESYRVLIPAAKALTVNLYAADGSNLGEWPLHDLSVGGVGATLVGEPRLDLGQTIARVSLLLPDLGAIDCSVSLRHATGLAQDEVLLRYRIGLGFSGLLPAMRAAIQRYIISLEQERRGMAEGANADAAID